MKLTDLNYELALQINEIWEKYWSEYTLPDDNDKIIDTVAVDDDGKVVAYGQVRHFTEMMFFPDMAISNRKRLEALKIVIAEGFRGVDQSGYGNVYMMCKDMKFARLIAKHFDFTLVENPGVLLVRKME